MNAKKIGLDIHVPFIEHIGVEMLEKLNGRVKLKLEPREEFLNSWGSIHGGLLMSVLDAALGSAGRSIDKNCVGAATIELKANFIAAAKGPILAEGRAQRSGKSLIFSEGEITDEDGNTLAKGTGTFKLLYPREK